MAIRFYMSTGGQLDQPRVQELRALQGLSRLCNARYKGYRSSVAKCAVYCRESEAVSHAACLFRHFVHDLIVN